MSQVSLLDRLLFTVNPRAIAGMTPDAQARQSIVRHLTLLFNTRKGSVPIDPDYGLSDMNNIAGSLAVGTSEQICAELIQQIERYEPRLSRPKITAAPEHTEIISLKYELNALLMGHHGRFTGDTFAMFVRINAAGRVRLESRRDR